MALAAEGFLGGLSDVSTSFGRFASARGPPTAAEYWSWGNPAVREVTRNVLGVGGTTGAVAGAGYLLSGMLGRKRQRIEDNMNNSMDDYPVVGGDMAQMNRVTQKRKFKRGRIGRKLNKLNEEFVQRWQRIYPYGNSTADAYPSGQNENNSPGCSNPNTWPTLPVATNENFGRLPLSHVTAVGGTTFQYLPGYLIDLTCWNNSTNNYAPVPVKRLALNAAVTPNFQWVPIAQNFNRANYHCDRVDWGPESGPSGTGVPSSSEQKALLSWSDIRLVLYGAKKFCTRVTIQFVQFNDGKYTMDYHPDGEAIGSMTQSDANMVNQFWMNEFKKYTFNPIDVQNFQRERAIKVLHSETFCINSETTDDTDTNPIAVVKQYFKRFNRLVNWRWNQGNSTTANNIDNPDFQQTDQGQLLGYANPKARVYLYIRAEDFISIGAGTAMTEALDRECTFDIVMRNKWRIQT